MIAKATRDNTNGLYKFEAEEIIETNLAELDFV
jgi:hypothetical protein